MHCVFIQIRCKHGTTYKVADQIYAKEFVSELYSTSGDYDLLAKVYIEKDLDIGKFINDTLYDVDGIERTYTIITFHAF